MNPGMKHEYFPPEDPWSPGRAACRPPVLYTQDIDWTCALACCRSIASGIVLLPDDAALVDRMGVRPGPIYSDLIKSSGIFGSPRLEAAYGCDKTASLRDLWQFLHDGWRVMVNWMYSYDHWTVLLEYGAVERDPDYHMMAHWDPYCGEEIRIRQAHFQMMWMSGGNEAHAGDFIAVRPAP